jgi:hypothetical protein
LAVEATTLPAVFTPSTAVSLAASTPPLLFDDLVVLRPEDGLVRVVLRDGFRFCERPALERDFEAAVPRAGDLRALDRRAFEFRVDLLFVC